MSKFEEHDEMPSGYGTELVTPNRHAKRMLDMTDSKQPNKTDARALLDLLEDENYARKSIATYYNAWRNYWANLGVAVHDWPKPPKLERKIVPVLSRDEVLACIKWMDDHSDYRYRVKAAAIRLLLNTGMRIDVEALDPKGWFWLDHSDDYSILQVTGKGGHQRQVVVTDELTRKIDKAPPLSYASVRRAWNKAVVATCANNVYVKQGNSPTLHSVRHVYARATYDTSGDILTTRDQMGHASVETTQEYLKHTSIDRSVKQLVG